MRPKLSPVPVPRRQTAEGRAVGQLSDGDDRPHQPGHGAAGRDVQHAGVRRQSQKHHQQGAEFQQHRPNRHLNHKTTYNTDRAKNTS